MLSEDTPITKKHYFYTSTFFYTFSSFYGAVGSGLGRVLGPFAQTWHQLHQLPGRCRALGLPGTQTREMGGPFRRGFAPQFPAGQTRLTGRLGPPSCGHRLGAAAPLAGGAPLPPGGRSLLGTAAPPPPGSEAKTLAEILPPHLPPKPNLPDPSASARDGGAKVERQRGRKGVWGPCGGRGAWAGTVPSLQRKGPGILGAGRGQARKKKLFITPGCPGTGGKAAGTSCGTGGSLSTGERCCVVQAEPRAGCPERSRSLRPQTPERCP